MAKKPHSAQFWRCMNRVRQIAGEDLTDSELQDLAGRLMKRARAIRAERYGITADEAVNAALLEMSDEEIAASRLRKRQAYLLNSAFTRELTKIQEGWADSPRKGLEAILVGSNVARKGAQRSVDGDQKGLANEWLNGFAADVERTGKTDMYASGDLDADIYKALNEAYKDNPDYTGIDRDAREFANIIFKFQELYRVSANNAGAWIDKLPDFITHQSHDLFKVRTAQRQTGGRRGLKGLFKFDEDANFQAWKDFVLPRLDEKRTFSGMEAREKEAWLRTVWRSIASGEHLSSDTTSTTGFKAPASLANRLSQQRLLHFKDGPARFEYDQKFGRGGSLFERVGLGLYHGAHNVALMRRLGPNPDEVFNRLKQAVRLLTEQSVDARMSTKWTRDERILNAYYDEVTGKAHIPGVDPFSTALRTLRLGATLSKLGGAVLSSIVDTSVAASELRYNGIKATDQWKAQLDGVFQGYGKRGKVRADRLQQASELGVAVDLLRSATWSRFSAEDALPGWAARAQHFFFRVNGLMWWTDTLRLAMAQTLSHNLALNASRRVAELPADMQRMFKLFNITSDEWDLMRGRALDTVDGKEYFSPKGADKITDVEIAHLLHREGLTITKRRVAERRDEIRTKFRDYFSTRSDYAVIAPGPRSRTFMTGSRFGIESGSQASEIMRSLSQFKGFPAAIIEKIWGREVFGYGESGRVRDMTASGMAGMAQFLVYSTFLGFLAMYLKAYFNGRRMMEPETPDDYAKLFTAAFLQGGGAGLYGDFLFGHAKDRYGHSALEALLGPSYGNVVDAYRATRGAIETPFDYFFNKAKEGDGAAASTFFAVKNNFPLVNLFYTRMAFDYLFWFRMQEQVAPGSLKKTEKNIQDYLQQQYKLPPSQNYRVEDMTTQDLGRLLAP